MRTTLVLLLMAAAPLSAGEISIGVDTMYGGTKVGSCHVTRFTGPGTAVSKYKALQKAKFEEADPAVVARLGAEVQIAVDVVAGDQTWCAQNPRIPEKIVIAVKGAQQPVLTIPLERQDVELANLQGAKFTATNGTAVVSVQEIRKLVGEYDFHLVYAGSVFKDKWKKGYADQILKP